MSFSRQFPDEILHLIVRHTIPITPKIKAVRRNQHDLCQISLASRAFHAQVQAIQFQDVYLASPERARAFLEVSLKNELRDHVRRTIRTVSFGPQGNHSIGGDFAGEVLAGMGRAKLQLVQFRRLEISQLMLWALVGE